MLFHNFVFGRVRYQTTTRTWILSSCLMSPMSIRQRSLVQCSVGIRLNIHKYHLYCLSATPHNHNLIASSIMAEEVNTSPVPDKSDTASGSGGGDVNKSTSTSEKSFAMEVEGKDSERPQVVRTKSTRPNVPRGYSVSQRIVEDG